MKNKNRVTKNRLDKRKKRRRKRVSKFGKEGAQEYYCKKKKGELLEEMERYSLRRNGSWRLY